MPDRLARRAPAIVLVPAAALAMASGASAADYQLDSGGPFTSVFTPNDAYPLHMNQYTAQAGLTQITQIDFNWYNATGAEVEVLIWQDPNNDGVPNDASVLWSSTLIGAGDGTVSLIEVPVPGVDVGGAGTSFFVGYRHITPTPTQVIFTSIDTDPGVFMPNRGFAATSLVAPVDPNNMADPGLNFPIGPFEDGFGDLELTPTLVIRAHAIPAPGTAGLLIGGGVLASRRRRR